MQVREVTHLVAVADELLGNVDELLELLRHGSGQDGGATRRVLLWGEGKMLAV